MALVCFSFLFSVIFTPLSVFCAARVGAIDMPDGERKLHARPTARLGGLALFFAVFTASLLFLPATDVRAALLSGGALLCVLGVSDDIFSLSPALKLAVEGAIVFIPTAFSLYPRTLMLGDLSLDLPRWAGVFFSVFLLIFLLNAYNLVDGVDMLASSEGVAASLALSLYTPAAPVLLGALLGFLPYNREALAPFSSEKIPTRSFLGDTGALFIGYALGVFALAQERFSPFTLLFFALPLYELFSSFFRRVRRGKNPFKSDRAHLHHRLFDGGASAALTVFLLFLFSMLFSSVGVLLTELFS